MIKIGNDHDRMVLLTDRLHDPYFPAVESAYRPIRWWSTADETRKIEPVKGIFSPLIHYRIEINKTEATRFLPLAGRSNQKYIIAHYYSSDICQMESGSAQVYHGFYMNPNTGKFVRLMLQMISYEQPERQDLSYADFLMLDDSSFIEGWRRVFYEWLYLSLPSPIQWLMGRGVSMVRKGKRVLSRAIFGDRT